MNSVAVYLRVSSKKQKVASQRREVQRYLDGHGIEVPKDRWYVDDGVSGATLDRTALNNLRKAVFMGEIKTVIVPHLDRIARNALDGLTLIAEWLKHDVRLVVVTLQIDFSGEVGQMVASLLLHIAQMERTRIRERQAEGIAAAKEAGKKWGGRRKGSTVLDYDRMLELHAKGLRVSEIATALGCSRQSIYAGLRARGVAVGRRRCG